MNTFTIVVEIPHDRVGVNGVDSLIRFVIAAATANLK